MKNEKCNKLNDRDYRKLFVENLKDLMKEYMLKHNISSEEKACEKIDINYETYKKWKTDYYNSKNNTQFTYPGFEHIDKLCSAFKVSYDELLLNENSHSRQETNLTIKRICEKTELSESTVLCLCDKSFLNSRLKRLLNYLCELNKDTKRLLKLYLASEDEKEKNKILSQIMNVQIKDNGTIYDWKRRFINYLSLYLFNRITTVKTYESEEEKHLHPVKQLYLLNDTDKDGLVGDIYSVNVEDFEKFYLETSNKYLTDIKRYYLKHDYDKEKNIKTSYKEVNDEINALFWNT